MNQLFTQSYSTLLRQAAVLLSGMPCMAQTMQPADLLHQAVAKLYQAPPAQIRRHPSEFGGLMRVVMKRTLVDCGRRAGAARRPDLQNAVELDAALDVAAPDSTVHRIDLDQALAELDACDPAAAELLRLAYLEGRTGVELAMRLKITKTGVSRRLKHALTLMRAIMEGPDQSRDASPLLPRIRLCPKGSPCARKAH